MYVLNTNCSQDPGRTLTGERMIGHLGGGQTTVKHLPVASGSHQHLLPVHGAVPGATNGPILIKKKS